MDKWRPWLERMLAVAEVLAAESHPDPGLHAAAVRIAGRLRWILRRRYGVV